jgi:hypothetical protein
MGGLFEHTNTKSAIKKIPLLSRNEGTEWILKKVKITSP